MMTQTMTDFGKYERFLTHSTTNFVNCTIRQHLAVDEVIVLYKRRVVQYIPKKHKRFGIKIYKLCDPLGYTYGMSMYLGKQR